MRFKRSPVEKLFYESHPNAPKNLLKPAVRTVPRWYSEIPRFVPGLDGPETKSVKHCIPFIDALTTGYMLVTPTDVYIEKTSDGQVARWGTEEKQIGERPLGQAGKMPAPAGYSERHFYWVTQTAVEIPEGYSAILTHPLNRYDLPFITTSGVVDGQFFMHGGNFPFHVKENFEGLIPQGTPFMQVIPFLRQDWLSAEKPGVWDAGNEPTGTQDYSLGSWYRRRKWQKKTYR